jgi:hypothetical protein
MNELNIRFPVTCPKCGKERLTKFPLNVVADALLRGSGIRLVSACHGVTWDATESELEQIRQYLGVAWFGAQGLRRGAL